MWQAVSDQTLEQGDFITDLPIPLIPEDLAREKEGRARIEIGAAHAIVISQTCDLVNGKVDCVVLCHVDRLAEVWEANPDLNKKWLESLEKHNLPGLHPLGAPDQDDDFLVVDFRRIYSLPRKYVETYLADHSHWRLSSPGREDLSDRFGQCYRRVAMPAPVRIPAGRYSR